MSTILIVPGLRDHVDAHWQTLLAAQLPRVHTVPPMGRTGAGLDRAARVQAIEQAAQAIEGPIVIVAHSGGCPMVAHWAAQTRRAVHGALLATPPEPGAAGWWTWATWATSTPRPATAPGRARSISSPKNSTRSASSRPAGQSSIVSPRTRKLPRAKSMSVRRY